MYITLLIALMFCALVVIFIGLFVKDKKLRNKMMIARIALQASVIVLVVLAK